jgi:hypothetical protein
MSTNGSFEMGLRRCREQPMPGGSREVADDAVEEAFAEGLV